MASPDAHDDLLHDPRLSRFGYFVEAYARIRTALGQSLKDSCDISDAWFEVLLRLGRSPDQRLRMNELADQLAISSGGTTRLIDRVADAGYVERRPCPEDRRVQWAVLTPAGLAKLRAALPLHLDDLQREVFDRLSADDVAHLVRIMEILRAPATGQPCGGGVTPPAADE